MSIKQKLLIPILSLLIVSLSLMAFSIVFIARNELVNSTTDQIGGLAKNVEWILSDYIDRAVKSTEALASDPSVTALLGGSPPPEAQGKALGAIANAYRLLGYADTIGLANAEGLLLAANDPGLVNTLNIGDRAYFAEASKGKTAFSDPLVSKATGKTVFAVASPVNVEGKTSGVLFITINLESFTKPFVEPLKVGEDGYAYLLNSKGLAISHPNKELVFTLDLSEYDFGREILSSPTGLLRYSFEGVPKLAAFVSEQRTGWRVVITANDDDVFSGIYVMEKLALILLLAFILLTGIIILFIAQKLCQSITHLVSYTSLLSSGNLTSRVQFRNSMATEILTLGKAFNETTDRLTDIISGIRSASETVFSGSEQLSTASQNLSSSTSEQAAAAEESAAAVEEMAAAIERSAEDAQETERLAIEVSRKGKEGNTQLKQSTESLQIIAGRIGIIEEIARNTNLLALNAAIEAARAGESGKGFSVVAAEIRKLAERSQEAAKEITETAKTSMEMSDQSEKIFTELFSSIETTVMKIREITHAIKEIKEVVFQVKKTIDQLDQTIQSNSSSTEEIAGMAEELAGQAEELSSLVTFFRICSEAGCDEPRLIAAQN